MPVKFFVKKIPKLGEKEQIQNICQLLDVKYSGTGEIIYVCVGISLESGNDIDCLLLTSRYFVILECKDHSGKIFGNVFDKWTCDPEDGTGLHQIESGSYDSVIEQCREQRRILCNEIVEEFFPDKDPSWRKKRKKSYQNQMKAYSYFNAPSEWVDRNKTMEKDDQPIKYYFDVIDGNQIIDCLESFSQERRQKYTLDKCKDRIVTFYRLKPYDFRKNQIIHEYSPKIQDLISNDNSIKNQSNAVTLQSQALTIKEDSKITQPESFDAVWDSIIENAGEIFKTKSGMPFTYELKEKLLIITSTATSHVIDCDLFKKAFGFGKVIGPSFYPKEIKSATYIWGILNDKRIQK